MWLFKRLQPPGSSLWQSSRRDGERFPIGIVYFGCESGGRRRSLNVERTVNKNTKKTEKKLPKVTRGYTKGVDATGDCWGNSKHSAAAWQESVPPIIHTVAAERTEISADRRLQSLTMIVQTNKSELWTLRKLLAALLGAGWGCVWE